jgi:transposase-like protein
VLAWLRGQKTIAELCREHVISETLLRRWREQFLVAGAQRLSGKAERAEADELRHSTPGAQAPCRQTTRVVHHIRPAGRAHARRGPTAALTHLAASAVPNPWPERARGQARL